jgi:hypothetical protein
MNRVEIIHFKGTDQPLLRDGLETFRASTVITEPYVMADKNKFSTRAPTNEMMNTHNFDRMVPSHWMNTSRSFAVLVGKSLALIGT